MLRSSLIVAAAALLCATAAAQNQAPARTLQRATPSQVKHAGVLDIQTGKWTPPSATKATTNLYTNTCIPNNGSGYWYYGTEEWCEELYDEGQIPSTSNTAHQAATGGAAVGVSNSYNVTGFEVGYCTRNTTVDMEVAFWNNLGGGCLGGVVPTGHGTSWVRDHTNGVPGLGTQGYYDLSGVGLPGTSTSGVLTCWIVGLTNLSFTLQGDGDGVWDNNQDTDTFTWARRINDVPTGGANGWIITGDPAGTGASTLGTPPGGSYAAGNCTFGLACGTDWIFQGALGGCGSGYNTEDLWWINADSGGPTTACPGGAGSGCYWYGGYATNGLLGSWWFRMEGEGGGGPQAWCTARTTSLGTSCIPSITGPSAVVKNATGTVNVTVGLVPKYGNGLLMHQNDLNANPPLINFGYLCIKAPPRRAVSTFTVPSGSGSGLTCTGTYNWNVQNLVNNALAGQADVGQIIYVQGWYRDSNNTNGANFTQAWGPIAIQ